MKPSWKDQTSSRCMLRSHWTFRVTQGGQQSSQPGGLHLDNALSATEELYVSVLCTSGDEVLWPRSTKFGFEVSGSVRDCLKKQTNCDILVSIRSIVSCTILYCCASEIPAISWVKMTKTYQDRHTETMFEHFSPLFRFLQLLASLRGLIEVKSDRWVSSRS